MKLKVEHVTLFKYDQPIYETATEVRLQPRNDLASPQKVLDFVLQVSPPTNIFHYTDFYGNNVHHFSLLQYHKQVEIKATSIVETSTAYTPAGPNEEIMLQDFLTQSRYVQIDPQIQQFARQFVDTQAELEPQHNRQLAEQICRQINTTLIYKPGVTDVHSTSAEVMSLGRGVCQDFAHLMIAVCRYLGLPTRYVSGYLYGGVSSEDRAGASHAWCEVYCGADINGWVAFDATHRNLLTDERYIKIGIGRDYSDVPPVRGTYKGPAREEMSVTVIVTAQ